MVDFKVYFILKRYLVDFYIFVYVNLLGIRVLGIGVFYKFMSVIVFYLGKLKLFRYKRVVVVRRRFLKYKFLVELYVWRIRFFCNRLCLEMCFLVLLFM